MKKVYDKLIGFAELSLDVIGSIALGATVYVGSSSIINKICPEDMKALAGLGCAIVSGYVALDRLLMKYRLKYLEDKSKIIENVSKDRINRVYDRIREVYDKIHDIEAKINDKIYNLVDHIYHLKKKVYRNELENRILKYEIMDLKNRNKRLVKEL